MKLKYTKRQLFKVKDYLLFKYYKLKTKKYNYNIAELDAQGYFSQGGQDKYVAEHLLPDVQQGFFVDIGAHDGITFSNSYYFEKKGWSGFAIEPNPKIFANLVANRNCQLINAGIGSEETKQTFRAIEDPVSMLSCFIDNIDIRHIQRIEEEVLHANCKYTDIEVSCISFNKLLSNKNIKKIDYLSIDVEGLEFEILKSIDFQNLEIAAVSVENNYKDYRIPEIMERANFKLMAMIGDDNIFLSKRITY